ncbi:MAG: hypothetical protein ACI4B3_01415 [Prevotella sp.]
MIRLILIVIMTIINMASASAVEWTREWIAADDSCRESQIWFLRTIDFKQCPERAFISAVSNGRIIIYVNGYIATTDVLAPYSNNDTELRQLTCEITPFIKDADCTIAVWYSPFLTGYDDKQLSLTVEGTKADGTPFYYDMGQDWLYAVVPNMSADLTKETETIDSRNALSNWNFGNIPLPLLKPTKPSRGNEKAMPYRPQYIRKTYSCRLVHSSPTTLTYLSPFPFHGWARVTLRGMKRGTQMTVNGLLYTCNGKMDEQACRRFTIPPYTTSTVKITSASGIKESNVMSVEAIDIW